MSQVEEEKQLYFETIAKLEDQSYVQEIMQSEKWEVIQRVFKKNRDYAQLRLNGEDPDNKTAILRWQIMIDFYDNVLPQEIDAYKRLGKEAYETADANGWLHKLGLFLKNF